MSKLLEAMDSLHKTIVFDSLDYSLNKRTAWMYGIIVGWDGPAMESLALHFGWTPEDIERLRSYRKAWRDYQSKHKVYQTTCMMTRWCDRAECEEVIYRDTIDKSEVYANVKLPGKFFCSADCAKLAEMEVVE